MTKVLFTGGRNQRASFSKLDELRKKYDIDEVVHGDAPGVDTDIDLWAKSTKLTRHVYPAQWHLWGKLAGSMRNAEMLKEEPGIVIAFPGGTGTSDMIARALEAGFEVVHV